MEQNEIRNSLVEKLEVADLQYDIKRLFTDMNYHKSKTTLFEQAIKAQQADLDKILGTTQYSKSNEEIYK